MHLIIWFVAFFFFPTKKRSFTGFLLSVYRWRYGGRPNCFSKSPTLWFPHTFRADLVLNYKKYKYIYIYLFIYVSIYLSIYIYMIITKKTHIYIYIYIRIPHYEIQRHIFKGGPPYVIYLIALVYICIYSPSEVCYATLCKQ